MSTDSKREGGYDRLFAALSDTTRRDIVRRCLTDSHSVSNLAERYPMSFAAVQKHVAVLETAGLVTKERHGREQQVRTNIAAIHEARMQLDHLESIWRDRVQQMDALLEEPNEHVSQE